MSLGAVGVLGGALDLGGDDSLGVREDGSLDQGDVRLGLGLVVDDTGRTLPLLEWLH